MLCDLLYQALPHQLVSTKDAPLVRGPGQLWPCKALYNLASLKSSHPLGTFIIQLKA